MESKKKHRDNGSRLPGQRAEEIPPFLRELVELAVRELDADKVWLFGSRSRNDARADSDFDLAFSIPVEKRRNWSRFRTDAEEKIRTLHRFDLVRIDQAGAELAECISKQGIILYERK